MIHEGSITPRPHPFTRPRSRYQAWAGLVSFMEHPMILTALAATALVAPALVAPADPHESFLTLLPAIRAHARTAFRTLRSSHDREDAEADVVAAAWQQFRTDATDADAGRLAAEAVAAVRLAWDHAEG